MQPRALAEQERKQARLARVVDVSVRRLWGRMRGRTWSRAWRDDVGPKTLAVITAGQVASASASEAYIATILAELDMPVDVPTAFDPTAFSGVTGGGVDLAPAAYQAVVTTIDAQYASDTLSTAEATSRALAEGERFMAEFAASVMADTMRAAEEVAMAQRPWVDGYVRVVEPGACSRCIVLAGKFFLFNEGFERHPRCRCNHVPAPSDPDRRRDLMTINSPERYFEALTEAEQDAIFTADGAAAIREGADIGRVVNARRGMSRAQVYGKDVAVTSAGVGRSRRDRQRRPVRLMPEAIFQIAGDDRDEALRLLTVHGYIT